ncbi:MAG: helix-turn-helix domain-containing protein [Pseudomonadota bacterium]|jgi:hypothetical protein
MSNPTTTPLSIEEGQGAVSASGAMRPLDTRPTPNPMQAFVLPYAFLGLDPTTRAEAVRNLRKGRCRVPRKTEGLPEIAERLADNAGYTLEDIRGKDRRNEIAIVRQLIAWHLYRMGATLKDTGRAIRRDHTTVIYAIQRINDAIDTQDKVVARIYQLVMHKPMPGKPARIKPPAQTPLPVGGDGGGPSSSHHS